MARAVVTGAAGFVGGALAHALRARGDEVTSLDVRPGPGITTVDVSQPGEWEKCFDGADLVVHAAAVGVGGVGELVPVRAGRLTHASTPGEAELRRVILGGTAAVVAACERVGVERLVHISCVSVLDAGPTDTLDETAPAGLTGQVHVDTLAAAEQAVLSAAAHGLPATVVRLGDAYGPRAGRWTLWPVLLLRAGRFALIDGGSGVISPVHVDDITSAVLAVADAPPARRGAAGSIAGEVLHVTGGEAVAAREFFAYYARMLGVGPMRSVPSRLYEAMDGIGRLQSRSWSPTRSSAGAASAAAPAGRPGAGAGATGRGVPPRLVRGLGHRLVAGAHPRAYVDLGPLTVRDLTRGGTYSIGKINKLAGWQPGVPLGEGMARTEASLRERGLLGVREPSRRG